MSERGEDREKASADRSGVRRGLGGARVLHQAQRTCWNTLTCWEQAPPFQTSWNLEEHQ